ncbi:hypothetical protein BOTBODRAFT_192620 [Botryobasidium botryosum FD-172 SS1]|uniref:TPR-like protein n=1 Tax=Botryobasidium botryosum (strain FD-172 SS1) TaxID=930990 RepID=A0A067LXM0_BOTB1|nr:hypothetical protein BOTBODRAFT_192620 [Botryobasidium botryosum FD-172 SS1]
MANLKASFFGMQLHSALCRGAWADPTPAKARNGSPISWVELLRKFRKHCPEEQVLAVIASQNQSLNLLHLKSNSSNPNPRPGPDDVDNDAQSLGSPYLLGADCHIEEEGIDEARAGLRELESAKAGRHGESIKFTKACYHYGLGEYQQCLDTLSSIDFLLEPSLTDVSAASTVSTARSGSISSAITPNTLEVALSRTGSVAGSIGSAGLPRRVSGELSEMQEWWVVERLRGRCYEGMAHEKLDNVSAALTAYDAAATSLERLALAKTIPSGDRQKWEMFNRHRELWRWAERALRRAAILASTTKDIQEALRFLRLYTFYSSRWPSTFRPSSRGVVYTLCLRALCLTAPIPLKTSNSARQKWLEDSHRVAKEYKAVLHATKRFPRAGRINPAVLDFVDLCMAIWERGGCGESDAEIGWVVDTMWWATKLTFQSHRVMRHLTRLLLATENLLQAKRAFGVYVQLVSKARETSTGEEAREGGHDRDDDRTFILALLFGARMLCRYGASEVDAMEADRMVHLAEQVRVGGDQALRDDDKVLAKVRKGQGIVGAALATFDAQPSSRPKKLATALSNLVSSSELDPTSANTFYHLALVQAMSRHPDEAVVLARQAVELNPKEPRAWHLLGLLLTARGDWKSARSILELGLEEETLPDDPDVSEGRRVNGASEDTYHSSEVPLMPEDRILPPSSTLHLPPSDIPPPTAAEKFEISLQLRITQLTLMELAEGAEIASHRWPELFSYFSEHSTSITPPSSRRQSIDMPQSEQGHEYVFIKSGGSEEQGIPSIGVIEPPTPVRSSYTHEDDKKIGQKVSQKLLKGPKHIHQLGKRITRAGGGGNGLGSMRLPQAASAPDLHAVLGSVKPYQASSIHSRGSRVGSFFRVNGHENDGERATISPPPPPVFYNSPPNRRSKRETRLLSNLWLASAANFRRMGKTEQARGAIMEAEVLDEQNPAVWDQLGLYFAAVGNKELAIKTFQKALVIDSEYISALIHLAQQYLDPTPSPPSERAVDLAAGILTYVTQGLGWDVPEAWYFLAKACRLQGRKTREQECLIYALQLQETRCLRPLLVALPIWL